MSDYARRRLNRDGAPVQDILRWAFRMEATTGYAKIMSWPDGRPPAWRRAPPRIRVSSVLHSSDCGFRKTSVDGVRLSCDCGALDRQTVTGSQPVQKDMTRLTELDMIAEASMLRSRALRSLRNPHDWIVTAFYTVPSAELEPQKRGACEYLGQYLSFDSGHDAGLMTDATWHWSGGGERRMSRPYMVWASELEVDKSTVYRWCRARRGWSAWNVLNELLAAAHDALAIVFEEGA